MPDRVLLFAAEDTSADALADEVRRAAPVTVEVNPADLPAVHETGLVAFVLHSPALATADELRRRIRGLAQLGHPVCLLVDDLADAMSGLPTDLDDLRALNAIAKTDAARIASTVRFHLGLQPASLHRRVFASYARKDAHVCDVVVAALRHAGAQVFRDIECIEGGEAVQPRILDEIQNLDFVLYLESASAGASTWVERELLHARARRIPIVRVRLQGATTWPWVQATPVLDWLEPQSEKVNLRRVVGFCERGLGARDRFDRAVERVLNVVAGGANVTRVGGDLGSRVRRIDWAQRVLVAHDPSWPGIEALHALQNATSYQDADVGVLITAGDHLPPQISDAVSWAGRGRLHVTTLNMVVDLLPRLGTHADR